VARLKRQREPGRVSDKTPFHKRGYSMNAGIMARLLVAYATRLALRLSRATRVCRNCDERIILTLV
jgi:hypothetical protein